MSIPNNEFIKNSFTMFAILVPAEVIIVKVSILSRYLTWTMVGRCCFYLEHKSKCSCAIDRMCWLRCMFGVERSDYAAMWWNELKNSK